MIGNRVRINRESGFSERGEGIILEFELPHLILVQHDTPFPAGHQGDKENGKRKSCWYYSEDEIEIIQEADHDGNYW